MTSAHFIEDNDISRAWGRALLHAIASKRREVVPVVVSITGFRNGVPVESLPIRNKLDSFLRARRVGSIDTVASTLFPISLWNPDRPRADLYARYAKIYPTLRKLPANRRGTYFGRLVADEQEPHNQLERAIDSYIVRRDRRSKLQVTLFDPSRDQSNSPQLGFPCLQHVAFAPTKNQELSVTALYANQYLVQRAYGNYLGLARIGQFVASTLGLTLTRVTCAAGIAQIESSIGGKSLSIKNLSAMVKTLKCEGLPNDTSKMDAS